MTKTDVPEIDATYNSIIKEDESAVLGKLLPPTSTDDSCEKKGKYVWLIFIFYMISQMGCKYREIMLAIYVISGICTK